MFCYEIKCFAYIFVVRCFIITHHTYAAFFDILRFNRKFKSIFPSPQPPPPPPIRIEKNSYWKIIPKDSAIVILYAL